MEATRSEILTVGHSTRAPGELEELLRLHGVVLLVDVRAHPGSRRMPHFAGASLDRSLEEAGIDYLHLPELGGRRTPRSDSPNGAWENRQFQGYADHMQSDEFLRGLQRVAATERRTALMCAEAAWWRCHRRLIADALTVRGWRVLHLTDAGAPASSPLSTGRTSPTRRGSSRSRPRGAGPGPLERRGPCQSTSSASFPVTPPSSSRSMAAAASSSGQVSST